MPLGLIPKDIKQGRRWLLVTGGPSIVAGVEPLAVPVLVSVATSIFFLRAARHVARRRTPLNAALAVLVGLPIVVSAQGTVTLTFLLAVWFFGIGGFEIAAAAACLQREVPDAWRAHVQRARLGRPGASLIVAELPSSASWAIGLRVGINLLLFGLRAPVVATDLGRLAR